MSISVLGRLGGVGRRFAGFGLRGRRRGPAPGPLPRPTLFAAGRAGRDGHAAGPKRAVTVTPTALDLLDNVTAGVLVAGHVGDSLVVPGVERPAGRLDRFDAVTAQHLYQLVVNQTDALVERVVTSLGPGGLQGPLEVIDHGQKVADQTAKRLGLLFLEPALAPFLEVRVVGGQALEALGELPAPLGLLLEAGPQGLGVCGTGLGLGGSGPGLRGGGLGLGPSGTGLGAAGDLGRLRRRSGLRRPAGPVGRRRGIRPSGGLHAGGGAGGRGLGRRGLRLGGSRTVRSPGTGRLGLRAVGGLFGSSGCAHGLVSLTFHLSSIVPRVGTNRRSSVLFHLVTSGGAPPGGPVGLAPLAEGLALRHGAGLLVPGKVPQRRLLATREFPGHLDDDLDQEVAARPAVQVGQAAPRKPIQVAALGAGRQVDFLPSVEGRNLDAVAQGGLVEADGHLEQEVPAVPLEERVRPDTDLDVEVAAGRPRLAGLALAGTANPLAVLDAGRNVDVERPPGLDEALAAAGRTRPRDDGPASAALRTVADEPKKSPALLDASGPAAGRAPLPAARRSPRPPAGGAPLAAGEADGLLGPRQDLLEVQFDGAPEAVPRLGPPAPPAETPKQVAEAEEWAQSWTPAPRRPSLP